MALTELTLINGISLMAIATVAILFGVWFLVRYIREKKALLPFVSILFLCWVAQYLGPLTTFWSLVLTTKNIDPLLYFQLSYTITPISILNGVWLGYSIFNVKRRKMASYIIVASAVPFYLALFGMPTLMYDTNGDLAMLNAAGEALDLSLNSIILLLCFAYILIAMIVIGGGFLLLRKKVTGSERQRATFVGIGYMIFGIGTILDVVNLGVVVLIIGRLLMATYLIFVYLGFSSRNPAKDTSSPPVASS